MQIQLYGVYNFCAYYSKNSKTIKSRRFVYRRLAEKLLLHKYEVLNKTKKKTEFPRLKKKLSRHIFFLFPFYFSFSILTIFILVTERLNRKKPCYEF